MVSNYVPIAHQNAYNAYVSRHDQLPWQYQASSEARQKQLFDQPILVWNDEFNTNPLLLVEFLRRVSDYMLLNPHPLYGNHNPNHARLYDVVAGKLNRSDYEPLMKLFGEEPALGVKDNHFFHGAEKTILSQILAQPFQFGVRNINTDFAQKSILDDAKKGAKLAMQSMLQTMYAQGEGHVAPVIDPNIQLPKTTDEWLSFATGQEQVQGIVYDLLQDIDARCSFQDIGRKSLKHKFRVNGQFAFTEVKNGRVCARALTPAEVRWMAGKPVEQLSDPAVFGIQVNEYMTPTELINTFGTGQLATGTGVKGALRYVEKLFERNAPRIGYDPYGTYWSSRGISADTTNYCLDENRDYTSTEVNWMRNLFYPMRGTGKLLVNMLVQHNFFTMLREKRFMVERVDRDGTRSPATDRELKSWQTARSGGIGYDIDFTPIGTKLPSRANVKVYARPQLWSFKRIGHDSFIDIGPYKYQPDFDEDTQERDKIYWPVVGRISYEKSMARLGEDDAARGNVLMQRVDMFLADMGYDKALIIDDTQGKNAVAYRYNAKMTGVVKIDSTKYQPGNMAGLQHLKTIELSNASEQLKVAWQMFRDWQTSYEIRVGAGPDVQGQTSPYSSGKQQQLNIANQKQLNIDFNWEHSQFMNELLQTCADVSKFHYAVDNQALMVISKNEQKILQLTRELRSADFAIRLESGQLLSDTKQALDQLVTLLMQSGGSDDAEALMQIILSPNPSVGYANYRKAREAVAERASAQAQQEGQLAQMQLADKQAQRDHEKELLRMEIEKDILVAQMRVADNREKEDFKGTLTDIKTNTDRENKVMDAEMEQASAEQQAALSSSQ
ncbi:PspA/IM30 family protein [Spirosoma sordidisoli]|uniref:Uncharacterized protein n=1 Tax=Spirosoma sordidisoli TaxID=2502893 RepID=A0A4Q2US54_9BACT|nr:hypothetical protein [Spirosoma sordidisoli]RYC70691.1 hypothetical protein EQG79_00635 [Spirosoma sordidisoli]